MEVGKRPEACILKLTLVLFKLFFKDLITSKIPRHKMHHVLIYNIYKTNNLQTATKDIFITINSQYQKKK